MLNLLLLLYRRYGGHIKDGGPRCMSVRGSEREEHVKMAVVACV